MIESVVREKQAARVEYEAAKAEGKKAALLEQCDPSLFSTAVANFLPGETVRVVLRFIQPLKLGATAAEVRFPMTTGVKYFPASATPGAPGVAAPTPPKVDARAVAEHHFYAFDVQVSGFPACAIESASHAIRVEDLPGGGKRVALAEEITIPDRDFVLRIEPRVDGEPASTVVLQRTAIGSFGMATVFPPRTRVTSVGGSRGRDVLFLLDHSGSMNGPRLTSAKLGLQGCLSMLETTDCFQIAVFDDRHSFYKRTWTPATPAAVAAADRYVATIEAGGGTMMQPALSAALDFFSAHDSNRDQIVIFLTDGDVGNEAELLQLLDAKIGRTRLFTFGIGAAPNAYLIGKMAERGRGQARFISDDQTIARALADLFTTLAAPVLTDLRLTLVDANDAPVAATVFPRTLRDVFIGCPVQAVFAAEGAEPAAVLLEGRSAGQPVRVRLPLEGTAARGDGVAKQFGRMLLEDLAEQQRTISLGEGLFEKFEQRLLETALRFQLVTERTSRVAVDREVSRQATAVLTSTTVAQYTAADQGGGGAPAAAADEELILVLSPFEVSTSATSGYAAATTLAGCRLNTELKDVGSAISVVTSQYLDDVGSKRLEEAVPATGEPMENAVFARPGVDSGLIGGLPIATVIDPNTVDRITVQSAGPAWTSIEQSRASFRSSGEVEAGCGDGGSANAKVALNASDSASQLAGLVILSHVRDEHARWSAMADGRAKVGSFDAMVNGQFNQLDGYGRSALGRAAVEFGQESGPKLRLSGAWHRLEREDPLQFRRGSPTARYDGLGFFNLDLLTAPVRDLDDLILQADLGGSTEAAGRHNWNVGAQWHRQEIGYVWPVALPGPAVGSDTLQFVAGDQVSLFDRRLHLNAQLGWAHNVPAGVGGTARDTVKWATGGSWEVNNIVSVFGEIGHEETVPLLPSGELRRVDARWESVPLPVERRDSLQIGSRVDMLGGRIAGSVSVYCEEVANSVFRDWAWEASHPEPVVVGADGWISPFRYGVCERLSRAGWRTEWNFQPLRNLTALFKWYEDWKNEGPVSGGNRRGMCMTRYDFDQGWLKGLSVGGGFEYRNAVRFNDGTVLAGGLNWNLLLGYELRVIARGTTAVRLSLRNLGGREYQPTRFANDRGRQILLLVSQEF